jgi:hypothetical protein
MPVYSKLQRICSRGALCPSHRQSGQKDFFESSPMPTGVSGWLRSRFIEMTREKELFYQRFIA